MGEEMIHVSVPILCFLNAVLVLDSLKNDYNIVSVLARAGITLCGLSVFVYSVMGRASGLQLLRSFCTSDTPDYHLN